MGHAIFVLQKPAAPDAGGDLKGLHPDASTDQIGWFCDALARVDENKAVAKAAMQEDGQGCERTALRVVASK